MKSKIANIFSLMLIMFIMSCASVPHERYNTQKGAAVGAGVGALIGQAIGHNTEGTIIGLASGTILGALLGNAIDQDYEAVRDGARYDRQVVYYDEQGSVVEAVPEEGARRTDCRKVTKRTWKNGKLIRETIEEICEGEKHTKDY